MGEITAPGDFQGLWEEGETGQIHRPVSHAFHQTGISTAFRRGRESVACGISGTCTRRRLHGQVTRTAFLVSDGQRPHSPKSLVCPFLPFSQIPSRDAVSRRITRHLSVRLSSANCHLRENCASRSISRVTIANKRLTEIPHIRTPMTLSRGANGRQLDGRLTSLQPRVE